MGPLLIVITCDVFVYTTLLKIWKFFAAYKHMRFFVKMDRVMCVGAY